MRGFKLSFRTLRGGSLVGVLPSEVLVDEDSCLAELGFGRVEVGGDTSREAEDSLVALLRGFSDGIFEPNFEIGSFIGS